MLTPEYAWLDGRELLVREIAVRVAALETHPERQLGFRAGLVVFLERRLAHLKQALFAMRQSAYPVSLSRRESLDRMVSALVGTLRHAEVELDAVGNTEPPRIPTMGGNETTDLPADRDDVGDGS